VVVASINWTFIFINKSAHILLKGVQIIAILKVFTNRMSLLFKLKSGEKAISIKLFFFERFLDMTQ